MTQFRNATLAELRLVLDWAAAEGWNPGMEDAEAFFQTDPDGFFVVADGSDHPVAAISVVNHTADFAFLGLYIVAPELRGQGIGFGLWKHALHHAGNRTVGLDGVEAQQQNYAASGFQHAGGTTRYSGELRGVADPDMRQATAEDVADLIRKEAAASGVAKPAYLQAWFTPAPSRKTILCQGPAGFRGFCTIRACRAGAKIGPLVADDTDVARRLVLHAATLFEGPVSIDVPQTASGLNALCQRHGLEPGFRTARMYRGRFSAPAHLDFAVASLELG